MSKLPFYHTSLDIQSKVIQRLNLLPHDAQNRFKILLRELETGRIVRGEIALEGTVAVITCELSGDRKFEVYIERKYNQAGCQIVVFRLVTPEEILTKELEEKINASKRSRSENRFSLKILEKVIHSFRNGETLAKTIIALMIILGIFFGFKTSETSPQPRLPDSTSIE
jgi:hypothetical protein